MKQYLGWRIDFSRPPGEPAYAAPDSMTWRVFRNPVALAIGGVSAVLLEFADPRVRTGVWEHSTFPTDPVGRARRTGMAAMIGAFGPRSAAEEVIGRINRMHGKVRGQTPEGQSYHALDGELLDWVAATASYGFLSAWHTFVRPVSRADSNRFFREGVAVGRLYGARNLPRSLDDFHAMCRDRMDRFVAHPIQREFLDIMRSGRAVRFVPGPLRREVVNASVSILPAEVRERLELGPEFDLSRGAARALRGLGRLTDRVPQPGTPAARASVRLGLPWTFPWRGDRAQRRLLARAGLAPEPRPAA